VFSNSWNLVTNGIPTTGTIVSTQEDYCLRMHVYDYGVQFQTTDHRQIDFQENCANIYFDGEQVPVLYNPHNPHDAKLTNFADLWWTPILSLQ